VSRARAELWNILAAGPILHAIALAARLGIPDLLERGPRTADDLARETRSDAESLYRFLRALASEGVLGEMPGRRFGLTPVSRLLTTDAPESMRSVAVLAGERWRMTWYDLEHAVRTGRPAFDRLYGSSFYEWLGQEPEAARRFEEAQRFKWESLREDVVAAHDFSDAARIVDVGGGSGMLLEAILERAPDATGVLVETPVIAAEARRRLGPRCEVLAGDFLKAVPEGGDVYVLAFVLHNWDDRRAARILRNCRRAMKPGGRVLVVETILPSGRRPSPAKLHDLEMLVFMSGGRERTRAEYRTLFEDAGLRPGRVVSTPSSASILAARAR